MDKIDLAKKVCLCFETPAIPGAVSAVSPRSVGDYQPYFDLLAADVVLKHSVPAGMPIDMEIRGKAAVIDFVTRTAPELFEDVRLEEPLEFIGTGDCVVILGRESYRIKKSGLAVRNRAFAVALDFRDGLIVQSVHMKDMSEFVDAYRSHGAAPNRQ